MTDEPRIYVRHAQACGLCGPGVTRVCERYGINPIEFGENGVAVTEALKLSANPLIRKAAAMAIKEWEDAHGQV